MKNANQIMMKLKQSGIAGLSASTLRYLARAIDSHTNSYNYLSHQLSAHEALSRYTSFKDKKVLEIGGAQSCASAMPFINDGAASVIVTGLDHISEEKTIRRRLYDTI